MIKKTIDIECKDEKQLEAIITLFKSVEGLTIVDGECERHVAGTKRIMYFCVGCRQIHYDTGFRKTDGDLEIFDMDKVEVSLADYKKVKAEEDAK